MSLLLTAFLNWKSSLLASTGALFFVSLAFFAQHELGYEPCILCIYIRVDFIAIAFLCIAAAFTNNSMQVIHAGCCICIIATSSIGIYHCLGLLRAESIQTGSCSVFSGFPNWAPLDRWVPDVFEPRAVCGESTWYVMGESMALWTLIIFTIYIIYYSVKFIHTSHKYEKISKENP